VEVAWDVEAAAEGTIEGAWMMTVGFDPVGDSAESGSTITVRVVVEVLKNGRCRNSP
jgi:hypothetical protein